MKRVLVLTLLMLVTGVFAGVSAQEAVRVKTIAFESLAANVELSPDDRTLAVYNHAVIYGDEEIISPPELVQIRLFDVETGEQTGSLLGHLDWVMDADFNSDGSQLVTYHRNGDLTLWDVASQSVIRTIETYTLGGGWVQFMPDDQTVLLRLGEYVFGTLDTESGAITRLYGRHMSTYNLFSEQYTQFPGRFDLIFITTAVSPDGATLAAATGNDEVVLIDTASGEERTLRQKSEEPGRYAIRTLFFAADGSELIYFDQNDHHVHRWDVAAGTEFQPLELPATAFAIAPDEPTTAWADRETNTVNWFIGSTMVQRQFTLPENVRIAPNVTSLAFTSDGSQLIVGGLYASEEANAIYVIDLSE